MKNGIIFAVDKIVNNFYNILNLINLVKIITLIRRKNE